jgi:DNA-binding response OmpR family regulator
MRLLVVDDDTAVRMLLGMALVDDQVIEGFRATDVHTAAKGQRVDAVIVDRRLPDGDGLTAVRRLRTDPVTCELPIIVITADDSPSQRADAFIAGADEHLYKPLDPTELTDLVRGLMATPVEERRIRRMLHRARMHVGRDDGGNADVMPLPVEPEPQAGKKRRWRLKAS